MHVARHPVHVTLRLRAGLRKQRTLRVLVGSSRAARERADLGLAHFSVQSNHLHLIVAASDRIALARGMQGLAVRVARRLNAAWRRRGFVFADRYHARALRTPREVRNALVYVLANARKHGIAFRGLDPFASGAFFDGWIGRQRTEVHARAPARDPSTWFLRVGWRRHGLIGTREAPRAR